MALIESGAITEAEDRELVEEARRSADALDAILQEMSMGSPFSNSVADTRYNT